MSKKDEWIEETQMFQEHVGTPVSSYEELSKEWNSWNKKRQKIELEHIKIHRAIQKQTSIRREN